MGWASAFPFFFCASPAPSGLQGLAESAPCVWVLQLRWCLLVVADAIALLPFPYLRVGVFLPSGVSSVGGLRRRSRLPFVVRSPFLVSVCPSPLLGLGWLVTGLWVLLRLLGFGLTMLGCAVLTPSPLAAPSPFVVVDFFLGRFFGLGLVGRVRASVPTFWWCSPSLVLGFAWRLWPFGGPGTCYFLGSYLGFFPLASSVGCCLRWLRFILGCPPSVASLWRLLPGLFVWSLLACPRGTAVPLASWVLWCS